jgi:hypothetical protein
VNNGGCGDPTYWKCFDPGCYAPFCLAARSCSVNNGGCGSTTDYACTDNADAGTLSCTAIGVCAGPTVCTFGGAYPCTSSASSYTCRGQFAQWAPADSPSSFIANGDGTVTDSRNGLVWQASFPPTYALPCRDQTNDCNGPDAASYCDALTLAGPGWRLPTKAELESLIDFGRSNPAIDTAFFPQPVYPSIGGYFWTASAGSGGQWVVDFYDGSSIVYRPQSGSNQNFVAVRCVR